jgi:CubicO group peptidase (beta-lactamase class C family)
LQRSIVKAAVAVMALVFACGASAQEPDQAAPAPAAASPPAALPKGPVPYTKLTPKPKPKPRAATPAAAPTAAPAPGAPAAPAEPETAGAIASVSALPTTVAGARLAANQQIPAGELEAFVDGMVKDAMSHEHIAGVTVSVVQNGQVLLKKGYGFASLAPQRPVDPERTLFRVGSISKTFTWIALMKEVEAGHIRLDSPINLYLPEKVRVRDQGYDGRDVLVMNLMDHSPGFEDRALGHLFENDFDRVRPLELYLRQERPKRVRAPGVVSSYSNYGAALAGEAVTYVSRKPFERLVEDEIFTPLGMKNTSFREPHPEKAGIPGPLPAALAANVSDAYRWTPTGFSKRGFEYVGQIAPAGAASSTAGDMARYMLTLLGGGQLNGITIYGPRTAQAFRTPMRRTPPGINGWAHGLMIYDLPGGYKGYGHGGDTLFFHSNMVTVPQLNLGIFISTNTETGGALAGRFPDRVVRQFYAAPVTFPRAGDPALTHDNHGFAGYYLGSRRAYSGLEGFVDSLIGGVTVSITPEGRLATTTRDGTRTWVPEGDIADGRFIATDSDQRLAFVMRDGRARAFLPSFGAVLNERASFWRHPSLLATLTALAAAAAIATFVGILLRNRREFRENQVQSRAALIQNIQAGLWLLAMALFALWASKTGDVSQIMYRWPGALLITASACAFVAGFLTIATLVALPAIWRGGRRVDSWTHLRKAFFTVTVAVYAVFAVTLWMWGALTPWSG